ncbi:MAG: aspartyl-phosphate phosphatase Spo0E family protein [Thermosipho sp. (in: Bacteria)]|nr:aspartyl-phosphate phosphatase Spo0E family protein [Thermosipho sp. (in: thermotogales)]
MGELEMQIRQLSQVLGHLYEKHGLTPEVIDLSQKIDELVVDDLKEKLEGRSKE